MEDESSLGATSLPSLFGRWRTTGGGVAARNRRTGESEREEENLVATTEKLKRCDRDGD